jgi:putative colanic acid biosysnthesis UDP-glucose lipid carrier transferase
MVPPEVIAADRRIATSAMGSDSAGGISRWPIAYTSIEPIVCVLDIVLIVAASVACGAVYSLLALQGDIDLLRHVATAAVVSAVFVPLFRKRGLYDPSSLVNRSLQTRKIVVLWTVTLLIFAGATFAFKIGPDFSRGAVLSFGIAGLVGLLAHHALWRAIIDAGLRNGSLRGRESILLCMDDSPERIGSAKGYARDLERHGFKVENVFHLTADVSPKDLVERAIAFARGSEIKEIFVAADLQRWSTIRDLIQRLCDLPLPLTLLPDENIVTLFQRASRRFGSSIGIEFQRAPLSVSERIAKRTLDLIVALVGIVLLAPMFLIIALAIKLDSRGPALFMQTRHGFNSKKFKIFKFRTMTAQDDGATIKQAVRGDTRVTNIGTWLRKTSIDELPQLFNVLKGEMSIVGPRPHAAAHDDYYEQLISCYAFRHHMKPGITGWAQVKGCRGETPTLERMKERVEHDIWYVDNWSVLLDLKIIFGTVLELIRGRNAY